MKGIPKGVNETHLTLTAAAITPRMKRAQRDCCYGTMTPISFPHHKKYCASLIKVFKLVSRYTYRACIRDLDLWVGAVCSIKDSYGPKNLRVSIVL